MTNRSSRRSVALLGVHAGTLPARAQQFERRRLSRMTAYWNAIWPRLCHGFPRSLLTLFAVGLTLLSTAQLVTAAERGEYVLGAGDVIRVSVFQNPDLTVETRVSELGTVTVPLLGSVSLGGLGLGAAEQKIAKLLRDGKYVVQPQVNILVLQVRGSQVSVLGQVNRPGRYALEVANMRVSDALALAGGVMPTGADAVVVVGARSGKSFRKEVDVPALFSSEASDDNIEVTGGDMIFVDRAPVFYIYGEVNRPGAYRLERNMSVMQALAQGGGVTARGTERGLRLNRRGKDGKVAVLEPQMDDLVRPDDVVYVRESLF